MRDAKQEMAVLAACACAGAAVASVLLILILAHYGQRNSKTQYNYDIGGQRHHKLIIE